SKDPAERDLERSEALVTACFSSEDYVEGRRAFMEKRKPAFKGR
ncbi:MAG: enoyl-CoA hydratase, partial [Proteobacteria bacterium]|nr:enoyl-CoA hydratase [Pseudomonadota bacterium]